MKARDERKREIFKIIRKWTSSRRVLDWVIGTFDYVLNGLVHIKNSWEQVRGSESAKIYNISDILGQILAPDHFLKPTSSPWQNDIAEKKRLMKVLSTYDPANEVTALIGIACYN